MKYGYFNYDPIGPSIFFYTDNDGNPKEMHFNIESTERLIEAISGIISAAGIDHVLANAPGLGLSSAIKNYLSTNFNYQVCDFELNK